MNADVQVKEAVAELESVRAAAVPVLVKIEVRTNEGLLLEVLDFRLAPRA